jgi:hypothetical protein
MARIFTAQTPIDFERGCVGRKWVLKPWMAARSSVVSNANHAVAAKASRTRREKTILSGRLMVIIAKAKIAITAPAKASTDRDGMDRRTNRFVTMNNRMQSAVARSSQAIAVPVIPRCTVRNHTRAK